MALLGNDAELAAPQKRHGGDHHAARFGDGHPAGDHHRVVGRAQQNPSTGNEAEILRQNPRDAIRFVSELLISPIARLRPQHGPAPMARGDVAVEKLGDDVRLGGIVELGQIVEKRRPVLWLGQTIANKRIDMRRFAGRRLTHSRIPAGYVGQG